MSRGFGSTFGVSTTDVITTSNVTPYATQSSISFWCNCSNSGGGTFGRILSRTSTPATGDILNMNASTTIMGSRSDWSVTQGVWHWTIGSGWQHILYTYDASSTSNIPVVYVNGIQATVSTDFAPIGVFSPQSNTLQIGNDSTGIRNFEGMIAEIAIWNNAILTNGDAIALYGGVRPLNIKPDSIIQYMPLDGINKPEFDFKNAPSTTITGTKLGTSDPFLEPLYPEEDNIFMSLQAIINTVFADPLWFGMNY